MHEAALAAMQNCRQNGGTQECCHYVSYSEVECSAVAVNKDNDEFTAGGRNPAEAYGKAYRRCQAAGKLGCRAAATTTDKCGW